METILKQKNKRGQIGSLQTVIITLVIIGVVLGVGFLVLTEFKEELGDTLYTVANESITPVTAGVYLANNETNTDCFHSLVVSGICNASDEALFTLGNISYDVHTGRVWNVSAELVGDDININYTYYGSEDGACDAVEDTIDAVEEIPTWLTIVVILFIVGILLFIVFKVMPSGGLGSTSGSRGTIAEV